MKAKILEEFPNYIIYENGQIFSINKNKYLSQRIDKDGYKRVTLLNEKFPKGKTFRVSRLIALAFIPNPESLPCVNHKDENKLNNDVTNLEWCTITYNNNYKTRISRSNQKLNVKVKMYDLIGNFIKEFSSIEEAKKEIGLPKKDSSISACCKGKKKTCHGYIWKYSTDSHKRSSIKVSMYSLENELIKTFNSIREAARFLKITNCSQISKVLKHKLKSAYGYIWKISEE